MDAWERYVGRGKSLTFLPLFPDWWSDALSDQSSFICTEMEEEEEGEEEEEA